MNLGRFERRLGWNWGGGNNGTEVTGGDANQDHSEWLPRQLCIENTIVRTIKVGMTVLFASWISFFRYLGILLLIPTHN